MGMHVAIIMVMVVVTVPEEGRDLVLVRGCHDGGNTGLGCVKASMGGVSAEGTRE